MTKKGGVAYKQPIGTVDNKLKLPTVHIPLSSLSLATELPTTASIVVNERAIFLAYLAACCIFTGNLAAYPAYFAYSFRTELPILPSACSLATELTTYLVGIELPILGTACSLATELPTLSI